MRSDRGLNNKGILCKEMSAAGAECGSIGLEAPYQIGKVERLGDIWKKIAAKVIETRNVRGLQGMRRMSYEVNNVVNEMRRNGGFSPAQWVLGRQPRYSAAEQGDEDTAGMIGAHQERADPTTIFAERMRMRHEAKKAFIHHDSSQRVSKALLRKAAPRGMNYRVGDLVSFQREQGASNRRERWSPPSRIIGFEGEVDKVCWVICEGTPFCLSTEQLRPANDSQALAYQYLHEGEDRLPPGQQQSYVDMQRSEKETNIDKTLDGSDKKEYAKSKPDQYVLTEHNQIESDRKVS